jgi:hypothetical protein
MPMIHTLLLLVGHMADVVSDLTTLVVVSQGFWDKVEKLFHTVAIS